MVINITRVQYGEDGMLFFSLFLRVSWTVSSGGTPALSSIV
jgi:hypothetical protein